MSKRHDLNDVAERAGVSAALCSRRVFELTLLVEVYRGRRKSPRLMILIANSLVLRGAYRHLGRRFARRERAALRQAALLPLYESPRS